MTEDEMRLVKEQTKRSALSDAFIHLFIGVAVFLVIDGSAFFISVISKFLEQKEASPILWQAIGFAGHGVKAVNVFLFAAFFSRAIISLIRRLRDGDHDA